MPRVASVLVLCFAALPLLATPPASSVPEAAPPVSHEMIDLGGGVMMDFVLVPAGGFVMGSADGESDEAPPHPVLIEKPFLLGACEVSQAEWRCLMEANPSRFPGPKHPVDNVTWLDAKIFLARLSARTGRLARLPTEAEWEYACRAGASTRWNFGDDEDLAPRNAWLGANTPRATRPVGLKPANAFGLHDMHGNVAEWCDDWYARSVPAAPTSVPVTHATPPQGTARVLRGGNWSDSVRELRSTARNCLDPALHSDGTGFRCVLELPVPPRPAASAAP